MIRKRKGKKRGEKREAVGMWDADCGLLALLKFISLSLIQISRELVATG